MAHLQQPSTTGRKLHGDPPPAFGAPNVRTALDLGSSPTVRIRRTDDDVDVVPLADVRHTMFDEAIPWRRFRWYKGQRHFSGSYWSATMQAVVGYESRLELANLLLADFDPRVAWILSQPFHVAGVDDGRRRQHIPDYLIKHDDGSLAVVDVKPASKLSIPAVRDSLAWSGRQFSDHGWDYSIQSEPDPVVLGNVRFLAGYRRQFQFADEQVADAIELLHAPMPLCEAVRTTASVAGIGEFGRSLVLHLLWKRELKTDLSAPLGNLSIVEPK